MHPCLHRINQPKTTLTTQGGGKWAIASDKTELQSSKARSQERLTMKEQAYTLAMYKVKTGREKDFGFVCGMLRSGFITESVIQSVVGELKPGDTDTVLKRLPLCR